MGKIKVINDNNFRRLYETDIFIAGNIFEYAYLFNKATNTAIDMGDFYGDPHCALIDINNQWCLIGGETLSVWKVDSDFKTLANENLTWITRMRQIGDFTAELLVEGASGSSAGVWMIDITSFESKKMKDIKSNPGVSEGINW